MAHYTPHRTTVTGINHQTTANNNPPIGGAGGGGTGAGAGAGTIAVAAAGTTASLHQQQQPVVAPSSHSRLPELLDCLKQEFDHLQNESHSLKSQTQDFESHSNKTKQKKNHINLK
jgi:uncharacterized protein HemX